MEVGYAVGAGFYALRDVGRGEFDGGFPVSGRRQEHGGVAREVDVAVVAFVEVVGVPLRFVEGVEEGGAEVVGHFGRRRAGDEFVCDAVYHVAAAGLLREVYLFLPEVVLVAHCEGEPERFVRGVVAEEDLQFAAVGADEGQFVGWVVDHDFAFPVQQAGVGPHVGAVRRVELSGQVMGVGVAVSAAVGVAELPLRGVEAQGQRVAVAAEGGFGEGEPHFVHEDVAVAGVEQGRQQQEKQDGQVVAWMFHDSGLSVWLVMVANIDEFCGSGAGTGKKMSGGR